MILAILNLHVAPMPPTVWALSDLVGHSESLCCFHASHQVSAQSDTVWEMSFEEFQDGRHGSYPGYQNGTILAILNLYVAPMPPIKFRLNLTRFGRRCLSKNFKIAAVLDMAAILDIRTERF